MAKKQDKKQIDAPMPVVVLRRRGAVTQRVDETTAETVSPPIEEKENTAVAVEPTESIEKKKTVKKPAASAKKAVKVEAEPAEAKPAELQTSEVPVEKKKRVSKKAQSIAETSETATEAKPHDKNGGEPQEKVALEATHQNASATEAQDIRPKDALVVSDEGTRSDTPLPVFQETDGTLPLQESAATLSVQEGGETPSAQEEKRERTRSKVKKKKRKPLEQALQAIDHIAYHKRHRNLWVKGSLLPEKNSFASANLPGIRYARLGRVVRGVGVLTGTLERASLEPVRYTLQVGEHTTCLLRISQKYPKLKEEWFGKQFKVFFWPTFDFPMVSANYAFHRLFCHRALPIQKDAEANENCIELIGCLWKVCEDGVIIENFAVHENILMYTPALGSPLEGWAEGMFVSIRGVFDVEKSIVVMTEGETLSFVSEEELAEHLPPEIWQVPPFFPEKEIENRRTSAIRALYRDAALHRDSSADEMQKQAHQPKQPSVREQPDGSAPINAEDNKVTSQEHQTSRASEALVTRSPFSPSNDKAAQTPSNVKKMQVNALPGKMEMTVKIKELPKVLDVENGHKRMYVLCNGVEVSVTLRPKLFNKMMKSIESYPSWVATFGGEMGPRTKRGFVLENPTVTVFEKKTKES